MLVHELVLGTGAWAWGLEPEELRRKWRGKDGMEDIG
jgi:hypothetical protein